MKIPLNRVIAFAGPYVSLGSAAVAAWLVAKLNVLGLPELGTHQAEVATYIAGGVTALLTAGLTWAGQSKWLKGHHIVLAGDAQVQAAGLMPAPAPAQLAPGAPVEPPVGPRHALGAGPPAGDDDDLDATEAELLTTPPAVSDETEFGAGYGPDSRETPDRPDEP